jgi:glycopeptide antibiotics resistance protein
MIVVYSAVGILLILFVILTFLGLISQPEQG